MYSFIENNFSPSYKFIQSAVKGGSIIWKLSSGKIISVKGIEYNELKLWPKETQAFEYGMISDVFPIELYRKVKFKVSRFLIDTGIQKNKKYLYTLAANNSQLGFSGNGSHLIYVLIENQHDLGQVTITRTEGIENLNTWLFLINEIEQEFKGRIVYAASLKPESTIHLIKREFDILNLLAKGYTSESIAYHLCISKHTVDDYRKELLLKFKVKNIFQLIYHAHKEGYL